MESKNVTEIYSQLAKGTFLEQDRTSNFPGENIKAWEEYCETSLDLCELEEVSEEQEVDEHGYPLKLGDFYVS